MYTSEARIENCQAIKGGDQFKNNTATRQDLVSAPRIVASNI